ncbi:MAG TPA: hypothetical protein PKK03_07895 [Bacteroidales bacterium]|nr:hypothetical protein [Bacteroidales bacterium]HPS97927.1 hypothetical protein [Bacteroidales bacterium]
MIVIAALSCIGAVSSTLLLVKNGTGQENSEQSIENFYMNELIKASIENECIELGNPIVYPGKRIEEQVPLFDIVDQECLVFRFSGAACDVCVDFVLEKIKNRFSDFSSNPRILLIGSNLNPRVKEDYYGKSVLSYASDDLGIPFEEYQIPFLFILDRDRTCKMIFIPEKALPELTDLYLDTVLKRYFTAE